MTIVVEALANPIL